MSSPPPYDAGKPKQFNDWNIRESLHRGLVRRMSESLHGLNLPEDAPQARDALERLTHEGCDRDFVLQVTWLYAFVQYALEENQSAESMTRPEYRRLSLLGASWTRARVGRHIRTCSQLASEIEEFLRAARIPGERLRESAEVVMFLKTLPNVLQRYARFVEHVAEAIVPFKEARAQLERLAASLLTHVEQTTGRPHYREVVDIILAWQPEFPFKEYLNEDRLRMQYKRGTNRPDALPLFRPKATEQT